MAEGIGPPYFAWIKIRPDPCHHAVIIGSAIPGRLISRPTRGRDLRGDSSHQCRVPPECMIFLKMWKRSPILTPRAGGSSESMPWKDDRTYNRSVFDSSGAHDYSRGRGHDPSKTVHVYQDPDKKDARDWPHGQGVVLPQCRSLCRLGDDNQRRTESHTCMWLAGYIGSGCCLF